MRGRESLTFNDVPGNLYRIRRAVFFGTTIHYILGIYCLLLLIIGSLPPVDNLALVQFARFSSKYPRLPQRRFPGVAERGS